MLKVIASSSAGNCYLWNGELLIEAGLSARDIMRGCDFRAPAFCLVSHEHGDHAKGAGDLVRLGVPVFASEGTLKVLGINGGVLRHGETYKIGAYSVLPLRAEHDAEEPLMFVVDGFGRRLLFATDTASVPYRVNGVTDLAIEANFSEPLLLASRVELSARIRTARSHMSIEGVLRWLRTNDLSAIKSITLLHLSGTHSDEEAFRRMVEKQTGIPTTIAKEV